MKIIREIFTFSIKKNRSKSGCLRFFCTFRMESELLSFLLPVIGARAMLAKEVLLFDMLRKAFPGLRHG